MPIDEARRKQLQTLLGGGTSTTGTGVPSGLPPGVQAAQPYVSSLPLGRGGRLTIPPPPDVLRQQLSQKRAERQMQAETPVPTEFERKSSRVARAALAPLQEIRQMLQVEGESVKQRGPISITRPHGYSDILMGTNQKALRDKLNRTWDLLAMLRTGVAGEARQKESLRAQSNIGEFDSAKTIIERIKALEREIRAFAAGELTSPLDEKRTSTTSSGVDFSSYTNEELHLIAEE